MPAEVVIHDGNAHLFAQADPVIDGERKMRGAIPRDYSVVYPHIPKMAVQPFTLIPQSEWSQRIRDKVAAKAQLSDIRMKGGPGRSMIDARDQNGKGYCWQHSGVSCMMMLRAKQNLPYADLSAYGPACIQKNFRDEGGWGAAGVDFLRERGCPTSATWPQKSMSRANDNPQTWAEAALYKVADGWWDLESSQYDRKLTVNQMMSLLIANVPCTVDFNWWSHSVAAIDAVDGQSMHGSYRDPDTGKLVKGKRFDQVWAMSDPVMAGISVRILNSWGNSWSDRGMGILTGSKAIPDGAVAPALVTAA